MTEIAKDAFYRDYISSASRSGSMINQLQSTMEKMKKKQIIKGTLPKKIIQQGLSNFGWTCEGQYFAFLSFNLTNQELRTINGIEQYKFLQFIDVSFNELTSLKPLSSLQYLMKLNASHNNLTKLLDFKQILVFKAPQCLENVDYSYNKIEEIRNLADQRFLTKLNLDYNQIFKISGLFNNSNLMELSMVGNRLEEIENLDNLNLVNLNLMQNQIKSTYGLSKLNKLRTLNLSRLSELPSLRQLYLSDNQIYKIKYLMYISQLPLLSELDLCFNPIQEKRYYRLQVLFHIPQLRILDGNEVTAQECTMAESVYGMDQEQKKKIFQNLLPEEEYVDRRVDLCDLIEPESESEDEDINFIDQYDTEGNLQKSQSKISQKQANTSQGSLNQSRSRQEEEIY